MLHVVRNYWRKIFRIGSRGGSNQERSAVKVPNEPISDFVKSVLCSVLELPADAYDEDADLFELGFQSVTAVVVLQRIEYEYGIEFSIFDLHDEPTPRWLIQTITEKLSRGDTY